MYKQLIWVDHAVTPPNTYTVTQNQDGTMTLTPTGTVVQQGTNLSAFNFNNLEAGVNDAHIAAAILAYGMLQQQRHAQEHEALIDSEVLGETVTKTLTNNQKYPFNSTMDSPTTVALPTTRKNLYYTVEAEVTAATGSVGEIRITDKALNGFKVCFDGSATSVTLRLRIKGGMT